MKTATTVAQMLVRLTGLVQLVLGGLFWTGNSLNLIPVHMLVGILLVLSLWVLAFLAARARVPPGLIVLASVWGLIVPILGYNQTQLLIGSAHGVIQVVHLLVGLGAIAQAERLAAQIKGRLALQPRPEASTALGGGT